MGKSWGTFLGFYLWAIFVTSFWVLFLAFLSANVFLDFPGVLIHNNEGKSLWEKGKTRHWVKERGGWLRGFSQNFAKPWLRSVTAWKIGESFELEIFLENLRNLFGLPHCPIKRGGSGIGSFALVQHLLEFFGESFFFVVDCPRGGGQSEHPPIFFLLSAFGSHLGLLSGCKIGCNHFREKCGSQK